LISRVITSRVYLRTSAGWAANRRAISWVVNGGADRAAELLHLFEVQQLQKLVLQAWTVISIAAAFKGGLAQRQVPVGAEYTLKAEYLAGSAPRWDGAK
jgi:hypothetical protein